MLHHIRPNVPTPACALAARTFSVAFKNNSIRSVELFKASGFVHFSSMQSNQEHEMRNLRTGSRLSGPSPSYLAIARSKSVPVNTPSRKKLLVLDLNGTLLLRPKLRKAILLRPYLPTFRSFLFHNEVASWLDVMVWSSAQPQNVDEMVERCFSSQKRELKAVWARDTLGLKKKDYCEFYVDAT